VSTLPKPPPTFDAEAFRRRLAGIEDPHKPIGNTATPAIKHEAIRLCSILASLFGDSLDRTTLWGRIGTAIQTSCAKVSDADLDRLVTLMLETVEADPAKAAACDALAQVLGTFGTWDDPMRHAFVNYLSSHLYAVVTHGRARWQKLLEEARARKAAGGSGEVEL
jgi:hypothetical protein